MLRTPQTTKARENIFLKLAINIPFDLPDCLDQMRCSEERWLMVEHPIKLA
jgi:hypothetical protein